MSHGQGPSMAQSDLGFLAWDSKGASEGKGGLESERGEQEVRGAYVTTATNHCHTPSVSLWQFWLQPEGRPMPLSVQSLGVRSERKDQHNDPSSYLPSKFPPGSSQVWQASLGHEAAPSQVHMQGSARGKSSMVEERQLWQG